MSCIALYTETESMKAEEKKKREKNYINKLDADRLSPATAQQHNTTAQQTQLLNNSNHSIYSTIISSK